MTCGHTAVFVSPGVSLVVGCLLFVCSRSAGGPSNVMLGVVPAWDRVVFFLLFFLGGKAVWGRVGVMGCLWWVSPKPLGQACWRCLVVPVILG